MTNLEHLPDAVTALRDAAMAMVRDERGVRVEDYLTTLAAAVGEAAIVDAGVIDIEANDLTPGAGILGDAINQVLTGDVTELAGVDPGSVVGLLREQLLTTGNADAGDFGSLERLYRHVVEHMAASEWGQVAVSVPEDHAPWVLPLQMAFQMRPFVLQAMATVALPPEAVVEGRALGWGRHVPCTLALASAIVQTAGAIERSVAITLSLEVVFGMAKMVPMSQAMMQRAIEDP